MLRKEAKCSTVHWGIFFFRSDIGTNCPRKIGLLWAQQGQIGCLCRQNSSIKQHVTRFQYRFTTYSSSMRTKWQFESSPWCQWATSRNSSYRRYLATCSQFWLQKCLHTLLKKALPEWNFVSQKNAEVRDFFLKSWWFYVLNVWSLWQQIDQKMS